MCTLFLLFHKIPNYEVAIVSNRDEMHNRDSTMLQGWNENFTAPGNIIFAPKDNVHGGTWFAFLNKDDFKYAVITNIRDPSRKELDKTSRGEIILKFLNYKLSPRYFISELKKISENYNLFNLVFGNKNEVYYFHSKTKESRILWNSSQKKEQVIGLSNAKVNSNWPKVQNTMKLFSKTKFTDQDKDWNFFKKEMQNEKKYPLEQLPFTGVEPKLEIFLSSLFINHDKYGTRSTLFFGFNTMEKKSFIYEQNYGPSGSKSEERKVTPWP